MQLLGGFGTRGIIGKLLAIQYARVNKIPFFGICLGMQMAVIEYCRNILGMKNATSTEFDENTETPVIVNMPEASLNKLGGTMRLGLRNCHLLY